MSAFSLTPFAQEKKKVAVLDPICRDNSVPTFYRQMVRGAMESAVSASDEYEAYDRSAFDQIQKEQSFQRTGAVNDSQIKKMGEMAGVDYILVTEVSADEGYLSTIVKVLNVTTGKYDKSADDYMKLSPEDVKRKCNVIASSIFDMKQQYKNFKTSLNNEVLSLSVHWDIKSRPQGADIFWRVISRTPEVESQNYKYLETANFEGVETIKIPGLTYANSKQVQIELKVMRKGYVTQTCKYNVSSLIEDKDVTVFFNLQREE